MRITLEHTEIESALVAYIGSQGINIEGKDIDVSMTAGRGNNGYTASISISDGKVATLETISTESSVGTTDGTEEATDTVADDIALFSG